MMLEDTNNNNSSNNLSKSAINTKSYQSQNTNTLSNNDFELKGFFGKVYQEQIHSKTGAKMTLKNEETFGPIMLEMGHEFLYVKISK